ncbi:BspA family leucine-rich repeat surface protein [Ichthyobacterium seriolicida]|uniref:BspA family leucine-rich repeat surface protein n=1 Tax=Ichthyobacterium seriolicida TaxID=242600 RepID=UPI001E4A6917|nr:BspA family leucine-rich repeat surface protein [Ichthyobacterium seriolicida]
MFILSCIKSNKVKDNDEVKNNDSGECSISSFILEKSKNEGKIFANRNGVIDEKVTPPTITLHLSESATLSGLKPTIVHSGVSFSPNEKKGITFNVNSATEYTVIAKNGEKKIYKVIIIKDLKSSKLISFKFKAEGNNLNTGKIVKELGGVISTTDSDNHTITINVPHDAVLTNLTPHIELHKGASISPEATIAQDFSSQKTYTVTAQDGTIATYNVRVIKNSEPRIKTFSFDTNNSNNVNKNLGNNIVVEVNHSEGEIIVKVAHNAILEGLTPTVTADNDNLDGTEVYSGDTGTTQANTSSDDFSNSHITHVKYTAVGLAGGRKVYNVKVYKEPRITELKFSKDQNTGANFPSSIEQYIGTVDEEKKTITVTVANQVNISSLNASISGDNVTATNPINITFTSTSGASTYSQAITVKNKYLESYFKNYTVTVTRLSKDFVSKWKIGRSKELGLPIDHDGKYDFIVDWGDGKSERITSWTVNNHTYDKEGEYTVTITGQIEGFHFGITGTDSSQIISISSWGNLKFGNDKGGYFEYCSQLKSLPLEAPNLEGITNMSRMFSGATSFNGDISNWDVSKVTDMSEMFSNAESFNSDISNWDVSKVTNMSGMFSSATSFNRDISNWDVSKVTDMESMFSGATSFNQDLISWNTFNVTNMSHMFLNATSFNGYLNNLNVNNVTNMESMFEGATSFNKGLNSWHVDVGNVTNMTNMFKGAVEFNQYIGDWQIHTSNAMTNMFDGATSMKEDNKPKKN